MKTLRPLQLLSRSTWRFGAPMRVLVHLSQVPKSPSGLEKWMEVQRRENCASRVFEIESFSNANHHARSFQRRFAALAFLRYLLHVIWKEEKAAMEDYCRFLAFLISHPIYLFVYGKLNVIDGLNRPDLVANMKQLSGNSVVIWRKDRNLPKQVNTINQEGCQKVKVFQVGSRGEIDDICALIITLFTNGRLYTNDKMRNHLKGFDNYFKDTIVEALLS